MSSPTLFCMRSFTRFVVTQFVFIHSYFKSPFYLSHVFVCFWFVINLSSPCPFLSFFFSFVRHTLYYIHDMTYYCLLVFQTLRSGDTPCCVSVKKLCCLLSPPCPHKLCRQRLLNSLRCAHTLSHTCSFILNQRLISLPASVF